ncbi:hypothetical protein PRBEI_2000228100 [Prionailurus iriomotensis]
MIAPHWVIPPSRQGGTSRGSPGEGILNQISHVRMGAKEQNKTDQIRSSKRYYRRG